MRRRTRNLLIGGLAVTFLGGGLVANALWNARTDAPVPDFSIGAVRFSAAPSAPIAPGEEPTSHVFSEDGGAVHVTLPGSKIIEVLEQTSVDAEPVIWRFTAKGTALGITGLTYDVRATEQRSSEGSHDLSSGVAKAGTVLEQTTVKVYRAAAGGDCSAVPETPELAEGDTPKNVHLFDASEVELQAPGAAVTGAETEQEWCVALDWNDVADGMYVNGVQVTGLAEDGSSSGAVARWHAAVGYPPALDLLGTYLGRAVADGTAEDTTHASARADWAADLYPDPSGEPDIVFAIDPVVTNLNPEIDPRD